MFFFRSTLSHVCPDSSVVSKCVLSAHIGHYKHIDPWTSDTAGCHVWRACAHRLTAQGYLKGCANFALFTAPINSVCFSERLCMVLKLDVGWSMLRMPAMLSCFCVSHVCAGYTDVHWPLRLFASPQSSSEQPCPSSLPCRPGRGKFRPQQSAGSFMARKVAMSFPLHFLVFSSLWPLDDFFFLHILLLLPLNLCCFSHINM